MIRTLRDEYTWWGPFGKDCRHPQSWISISSSDVTSPDTETRQPQDQMFKVLMDGGRLATSVKPSHHSIRRDCRHGKKQWLLPVDDDCFSTTDVDAPSDMDSGLESSSTCSVWMNEIQHKCKINNVSMVVWHAKTNLYIIEQVIWQAKRPGEIIVNKREKKVCDSGVGLHKWRYQLFLVLI